MTPTKQDETAKLAYALAGKLPASDGIAMVRDMCRCDATEAAWLIARGKRLANAGRADA